MEGGRVARCNPGLQAGISQLSSNSVHSSGARIIRMSLPTPVSLLTLKNLKWLHVQDLCAHPMLNQFNPPPPRLPMQSPLNSLTLPFPTDAPSVRAGALTPWSDTRWALCCPNSFVPPFPHLCNSTTDTRQKMPY